MLSRRKFAGAVAVAATAGGAIAPSTAAGLKIVVIGVPNVECGESVIKGCLWMGTTTIDGVLTRRIFRQPDAPPIPPEWFDPGYESK